MSGTRDIEAMTLEQLEELLDTYGPARDAWPEAVQGRAERLVAASAEARALLEQARDVDRLLHVLPEEVPSPALAARVLAGAPRPRPVRAWRRPLFVAGPLAAAAVVTLWLAIGHEPARQVAVAPSLVIGEYTSPTDVLLAPYGVDVSATVPSVGCADSVLGCPNVPHTGGPSSDRSPFGRFLA